MNSFWRTPGGFCGPLEENDSQGRGSTGTCARDGKNIAEVRGQKALKLVEAHTMKNGCAGRCACRSKEKRGKLNRRSRSKKKTIVKSKSTV